MAASHEHVGEAFVLTRHFAAPRELVFESFTQLEHLNRWMGPKGFALVDSTLDLRPGGLLHYGMRVQAGS